MVFFMRRLCGVNNNNCDNKNEAMNLLKLTCISILWIFFNFTSIIILSLMIIGFQGDKEISKCISY